MAVAHRTDCPQRPGRRSLLAVPPDRHALGAGRPGRRARHRLQPAVVAAVHHPPVLVRAGPPPVPPAVLGGPAAHPRRTAARGPVDPAHQGRRAAVRLVPGGHLRRRLHRQLRRTGRRLLRPRSAGHPQHRMVPDRDHRHHPPRHPRGQAQGRHPAVAADGHLRRLHRRRARPVTASSSPARRRRPRGRSQPSPATPAHPSRPHNPERQRPRSPLRGPARPRRPP